MPRVSGRSIGSGTGGSGTSSGSSGSTSGSSGSASTGGSSASTSGSSGSASTGGGGRPGRVSVFVSPPPQTATVVPPSMELQ